MTDSTSRQSLNELTAKGKLAHDQLSVLNIFRKMQMPLTAREAYAIAVKDELSIDFNGVRSRITENESAGYLRKVDKVTDSATGKSVNRWESFVVVPVEPPAPAIAKEFRTDLWV